MCLYFAQTHFFCTFGANYKRLYMEKIIGRKVEIKALQQYAKSGKSEFVAIFGRRRVGKTFLVKKIFGDKLAFNFTGMANVNLKVQLTNFRNELSRQMGKRQPMPSGWLDAFEQLRNYLSVLPKGKRKYVFIDDMPWLDTPRSNFLPALEHFWNNWAAWEDDIMLIVCGSATSWITNKLINNHGGLHNRVTRQLYLPPFTLKETKELCNSNGIVWREKEIAECYMVMGGIPYYIDQIQKGESLAQCIDRLFFSPEGTFRYEFDNLYKSLFMHSENYIDVVKALAGKKAGLSRQEIIQATKISNGQGITTILSDLQRCDFIRVISKEESGRNAIYQLIDSFTLFYLCLMSKNKLKDSHFWSHSLLGAEHHAWAGLAFELLCIRHVEQIKHALGISGVLTQNYSWRSKKKEGGAQIDLVIDRADNCVNIVEIKFVSEPFAITADYEQKLLNKVNCFMEETKSKKTPLLTMLTTMGIKEGTHSDIIQNEITLSDLFE